jgi:DNA-binding GntR family transcriptional regulator
MPTVIPEQVAHVLRKAILKGELTPGKQLTPDELAKEFQTSRSVVCEGLQQLDSEGLVIYQDCQTIVADINEIFDIRLLLEPEALRLAIPNHTEQLWKQAEELLVDIDNTPCSAWFELNLQWHKLIYSTANRPRLLCIIEKLHCNSEHVCENIEGFRTRAQEEHRIILAACKKRDVDTACKALIEHINQRRRELINNLAKDVDDR